MSEVLAARPLPARAGVIELAVIVPTFRERDNVAPLIEALDHALSGLRFEVIFVDDDSDDGTSAIISELSQSDARIRLVHRIGRRGLSSAVVEGALSTTAPFVAVIDGDLQHDERILPGMLTLLREDQADLVVGSRYVDGGSVEGWASDRQAASQFATWVAHRVLGAPLSDPMSGFFMLKRSVFLELVRGLSGQGFKILLDLAATGRGRIRIKELPYQFRTRTRGESKLDSMAVWEYGLLVIDKLTKGALPSRFVSFMIIGGMGIVVHMCILSGLYLSKSMAFAQAQAVATIVSMTFNFFVNNTLTYRDRRIKGIGRLLLGLVSFYAVCSFGAAANVGVANVLFGQNATWWLSALAGILVGAVWNFVASNVFTWRKK